MLRKRYSTSDCMKITGNLLRVVVGFIRILEGLVMVLSMGIAYPLIEMKFLIWNLELKTKKEH